MTDMKLIILTLCLIITLVIVACFTKSDKHERFSVDLGRINGFPKLDSEAYSTYAGTLWNWSPSNANQQTIKMLTIPTTTWQEAWSVGIKQISMDAINSWVKFTARINTFLMWSDTDYQGQLLMLPFDPKVVSVFSATNPLWISMFQTIWMSMTPGKAWSCVVPNNYDIIARFENGEPVTLNSNRYYNNLPYPSRLIELRVVPMLSNT